MCKMAFSYVLGATYVILTKRAFNIVSYLFHIIEALISGCDSQVPKLPCNPRQVNKNPDFLNGNFSEPCPKDNFFYLKSFRCFWIARKSNLFKLLLLCSELSSFC